jgi:hypothetical protein
MEAAKHALKVVLGQLDKETQLGIVVFSDAARDKWIYPLGPIDQKKLQTAINSVQSDGGTPLGEYMKIGADALLASMGKNRQGTYRLIVVTDGEAGDPNLVQEYLPDIHSRGITLEVIGVAMNSQHSLATQANNYKEADNPESLTRAIESLFAEVAPKDENNQNFELIAALPDDVAKQIVVGLTEPATHPIGELPPVAAPADGSQASVDVTQPIQSNPLPWNWIIGISISVVVIVVALGAAASANGY